VWFQPCTWVLSMKSTIRLLADTATVIAVLITVFLLGIHFLVEKDNFAEIPARTQRDLEDWKRYAVGQHVGPTDAPVVIVIWCDYECPVCRWFHNQLGAVREEYLGDLAIFYRHWPRTSKPFASAAAQAAECAAYQGAFEAFQEELYKDLRWREIGFLTVAQRAGVQALPDFVTCLAGIEPLISIEQDVEAVRRIGGTGTPTVIFNGTLLGSTPDSIRLETMIVDVLHRR